MGKTTLIRSPLRYPGGKSRALKQILPLVPDYSEFREPFLGGGSVLLRLQQLFPDRLHWGNDLYPALFAFWSETQRNVENVLQLVEKWKSAHPDGRELHRFLTTQSFRGEALAAAFFILNRLTFSGTAESGGYSKQAFEKRFTPSSLERVRRVAPLLQDVKLTNTDFAEVIEAPGTAVFLFLDPPYFGNATSALYGKNGHLHKTFDHERLATLLRRTPHRWLLTYDDVDGVRELYDFAYQQSWDLTYGMRNVNGRGDQRGRELFISNYSLPGAR